MREIILHFFLLSFPFESDHGNYVLGPMCSIHRMGVSQNGIMIEPYDNECSIHCPNYFAQCKNLSCDVTFRNKDGSENETGYFSVLNDLDFCEKGAKATFEQMEGVSD